jgi:DNA/RNA endonuclease YhcR with UshA esterase domain
MIIDVQFVENDASFIALFEESDNTFNTYFGEVIKVYDDVPQYDGIYEVTPKVTEQILPTAQRFLARDVTIEKIPYFEVTNNSGGMTVSIGEV